MARVARVRRLVVGVAIAMFVVPVAIVIAVELATRAGHDELRERVTGAVSEIATTPEPDVAAIARRFAVDAWLVDPQAQRVVATTKAMPVETDLGGLGLGVSSAGFGSLTGSAAMLKETYTAGRVEPWQREAVVRAREHGAAESCATVEPDAIEGGLYGGDTLWSCEAARRRGDGRVVLVEASAPRAASKLVDVRGPLLVLAAIVIAVGGILTAWLVRRLARPLGQLHARVEAMTAIPRRGDPPAVATSAPHEIAEVAAAVDALVARLDAARAEQAEAAADLAHELKGPLSRIKAMDLADANEAVRAIDRIVVELLEIARAEAGLALEARADVALDELARNARTGVAVSGTARARVAPEAMARAIGHLVDNARAFGSDVRVEVAPGSITVTDDGPGVAPELAPTLFRRFASRRAGGTGLGLAYVRAVAEAHGGKATYARVADRTCFTIHI